MAHTSGPWQIARATEDKYHVDIETVDRGKDLPEQGNHLATAYWHPGPDGLDNAKLMAAAPELLEACRAFLRAPHSGSSGPGYSTIEVTGFNLKAARAAIAKATGK